MKGIGLMDKIISMLGYSWEKKSLNSNWNISPDKREKWEKILGKNVYQMVEKERGYLLSNNANCEDIEGNQILLEIKNMYDEYLKDFDCEKLHVQFSSNSDIVFYPFFFSLFNYGIKYFEKKAVNLKLNDAIKKSYISSLADKFEMSSLKTLIFEMDVCKKLEELKGETPEEEYECYLNKFLKDKEYVKELFSVYPVLLRILFETIQVITNNYIEILQHLETDKEDIIRKLLDGRRFDEIKYMSGSLSDSHKGAKGVYHITLDNGIKIIYKPHTLECEINYQKMLQEVMDECGLEMRKYAIISRENYGWCQFVNYNTCKNEEELERYYKRIGIIICINYILRTNDLHYENIIASGEYPIIVDLETIMTNKHIKNDDSATEIIQEMLTDSVLNSGILPHYIWNAPGKIGINISALSGGEGQTCPIQVAKIVDSKTSNMHIEYEYPKSFGKNNLATINGEFIDPHVFKDSIAEGFSACYRYIVNHIDYVQNFLGKFRYADARYLIRDTQQYSLLLRASYHPTLLQSAADRELFFYSLFKHVDLDDSYRKETTNYEIKDMVLGDIPFFYFKTTGTSLFSSQGDEIKNFFYTDSYSRVIKKLKIMSDEDCDKQKLYILLTLSKTTMVERLIHENQRNMWKHYINTISISPEESYLEGAKLIADSIIEKAVFNKEKTDVNWIGISLGNEEEGIWDIEPLGMYLYDGIAGIAVFFKRLCFLTHEKEYKEISNILDQTLFRYTDMLLENPEYYQNNSVGAFFGEASILYAYEIFYSIDRQKKYMEYAKKHYSIVLNLVNEDKDYDFLLGSCGAIQIILNLYELSKDREYLEKGIEIASNLVNEAAYEDEKVIYWISSQASNALAGLSHGQSGFALVFARLGKLTGDSYYFAIMDKIVNYENQMYSEKAKNWTDKRIINGKSNEEKGVNPVAWCHGATGILLSRISIYRYVETEDYKKKIMVDIDRAVKSTLEFGYRNNYCLCHGDFGNLEILRDYAIQFHDTQIKQLCDNLLETMLGQIVKKEWHCGLPNEYENPSFMTGLAGIGYSLMRRYDFEIPTILALEIGE